MFSLPSVIAWLCAKEDSGLALDLSRVFKAAWHYGLIHKMMSCCCSMYLSRLVISFLGARTYKVKVGNAVVVDDLVVSGIPQGSVLALLLFRIDVGHVPSQIGSVLSSTVKYKLQRNSNRFLS